LALAALEGRASHGSPCLSSRCVGVDKEASTGRSRWWCEAGLPLLEYSCKAWVQLVLTEGSSKRSADESKKDAGPWLKGRHPRGAERPARCGGNGRQELASARQTGTSGGTIIALAGTLWNSSQDAMRQTGDRRPDCSSGSSPCQSHDPRSSRAGRKNGGCGTCAAARYKPSTGGESLIAGGQILEGAKARRALLEN